MDLGKRIKERRETQMINLLSMEHNPLRISIVIFQGLQLPKKRMRMEWNPNII